MSSLVVETRKMIIGIKQPKEIEIFPLSFGQQKKFADQIGKALVTFSETAEDGLSFVDMVKMILQLIEENVTDIFTMVTEEELDLDKVTNTQLADFCNIVYEMNFEESLKKVNSLVEKVKKAWT